MSKIAPTLAERLKDPKVQAEIRRHSAKLTAEEHGWVVLEPKHVRALLAVARAAGPAMAEVRCMVPEWARRSTPIAKFDRALSRLSRASRAGRGR